MLWLILFVQRRSQCYGRMGAVSAMHHMSISIAPVGSDAFLQNQSGDIRIFFAGGSPMINQGINLVIEDIWSSKSPRKFHEWLHWRGHTPGYIWGKAEGRCLPRLTLMSRHAALKRNSIHTWFSMRMVGLTNLLWTCASLESVCCQLTRLRCWTVNWVQVPPPPTCGVLSLEGQVPQLWLQLLQSFLRTGWGHASCHGHTPMGLLRRSDVGDVEDFRAYCPPSRDVVGPRSPQVEIQLCLLSCGAGSALGCRCCAAAKNILVAKIHAINTNVFDAYIREYCQYAALSGVYAGVVYIFTWKYILRHNGLHFFDILSSKSIPKLRCFIYFTF